MKKISLIFCLFLIVHSNIILSQIVYYDALKLDSLYKVDPDNIPINGTTKGLLKNYYNSIPTFADQSEVDSFFVRNPFFRRSTDRTKSIFLISGAQSAASSHINKFSEAVGGINISKYANAISALMIERAKEELNVAFFDRFKQFSEDNPEFKVLFPKSTEVLGSLVSYKYPEMLPSLRTAFTEDIAVLPNNLDDLLELPRYRELLKNFPEIRIAIRSIKLIQELETGSSNAADIIKEFSELDDWNDITASRNFKNAANGVELGAIFSESLRNKNKDSLWVSPQELKEMLNDKITFQIYLGLIWQSVKNHDITFYKQPVNSTGHDEEIKFTALLQNNKAIIEIMRSKVQEFAGLSNKTQMAFTDLKTKLNSRTKISNDDIFNYINVSTDIVEYALSFVKIFDESVNSESYIAIVRQSNNLFKDIYIKQYNKGVTDALGLIAKISELVKERSIVSSGYQSEPFYASLGSEKKDIKDLIDLIANGKKIKDKNLIKVLNELHIHASVNPILESLIGKQRIDDLVEFIEKVKPYALFVANIANAETAEDVKFALDAAILPVGSSAIKKYSCFNISVQSYLGAFYRLDDPKNELTKTWSDQFGVTAPIGVSFNWGLKGKCWNSSIGIFAYLFDLGAIVDYQLKNDSIKDSNGNTIPVINKDFEIEFSQVLSPGVSLQWGLPWWKLPLSLGAGMQYGPGLSEIESNGTPVVNNPHLRYVVSLTVDLPFFTIMNKPMHKKE